MDVSTSRVLTSLPSTPPVRGSATVPDPLIGCWHRRYIRFADKTEDTATQVIWVQTAAGCGDVRIAPSRPDLRNRRGFEECSKDELMALAEQDCFCAVTRFAENATPYATASWPADDYLFRFQPVITFPEPGWLEWREGGSCMIERAPSGAYEEDWRLQPNSQTLAAHLSLQDASATTCLYVAGDHAIYARNRRHPIAEPKLLPELMRAAGDDDARLRNLLDCEFSYARRTGAHEDYTVALSTLPWREGTSLGFGWIDSLTGTEDTAIDPRTGEAWTVESLWRP